MRDENHGVNLTFIKTLKPWQGKTFLGNWLAIPGFSVTGEIFINGNSVSVSGKGYHDHNLYPMHAALRIKGYHFGKIHGDFFTITWASITNNKNKKQKLVVLNKDQEFISIEPDNITYAIEKQEKENRKIIPTEFLIKVESEQLSLDVKAELLTYQHTSIPTVNYWRCHVRYKGEIQIDSKTRKIDTIDISEYLRFL
jgi:predicted secreted hydrolase